MLLLSDVGKALHPFATHHADNSYHHKRNTEQLSHVKRQRSLKRLLYLLCILDEESGYEDIGKTESEEEARAHTLRTATIYCPSYEEQQSVGYCLVELSWVTRHSVYLLENKRPRHIGHLTDNLGVHQVAKTYEACCHRCGNGNVVEHLPNVHLSAAHIEPKGKHDRTGNDRDVLQQVYLQSSRQREGRKAPPSPSAPYTVAAQ